MCVGISYKDMRGGRVGTELPVQTSVKYDTETYFVRREDSLQIWKKLLVVKKSNGGSVFPGIPRDLSLCSQEDGELEKS